MDGKKLQNTPRAIVLGGPNGAGKTTFAKNFLPVNGNRPFYINADLIAAGLAPFRADTMALESSRLMLEQIRRCVAARTDFAVETTLAGRSYINLIKQWQNKGYCVELLFLELPSVELAIKRVQERVSQGGHDIQESDIRRRFYRGRGNFHTIYKPIVNMWKLFNASQWPPDLISQGSQS